MWWTFRLKGRKNHPHLTFVREGVVVMTWRLSGVVVSERGGSRNAMLVVVIIIKPKNVVVSKN
jgi:hypothetical protein